MSGGEVGGREGGRGGHGEKAGKKRKLGREERGRGREVE